MFNQKQMFKTSLIIKQNQKNVNKSLLNNTNIVDYTWIIKLTFHLFWEKIIIINYTY